MRHALIVALALLLPAAAIAQPADPVAALRDAALEDHVAWDIIEGLTTEIGPRLAGSDAEARARDWAVKRLRTLGFANVHVEPFTLPAWARGAESVEIVTPFPQTLAATALGYSAATPPGGISAPVVLFDGMAALEAADPTQVKGRIVFVTHRMGATRDGSSYGKYNPIRLTGPSIASRKGAAAIVIRSLGSDHHRLPHAGRIDWLDGVAPIPAAALSVPDAEQLERILARGQPVTMKLVLTPRMGGRMPSGNVVAEVPGRDPKAGIILIGGHLDSWDLGTGAIDDAAGVAITTAAAKRILDRPRRPLRTIRLVWFGSEELHEPGGEAYAQAHGKEKHALVAESDFGADLVWRFTGKVGTAGQPVVEHISRLLEPLGVARAADARAGGSDIAAMAEEGAPVLGFSQDGTRYFDLHHTADDTLDKIDPAQLRQNVAAWTVMLGVVADSDVDLALTEAK